MLSLPFWGRQDTRVNFSSYVYGPTCRSFSIILKVSMVMNGTVFTWGKIVTKLVPFIKYMKIFQCTVKVKWFSCQMRPFPTSEGASFQRVMVIIQPPEFLLIFFFSPLSWDLLFSGLPAYYSSLRGHQYLIFLTESEKNKPTSFPKEQPLHPSFVG